MRASFLLLSFVLPIATAAVATPAIADVAKPAAIVADGIPAIPDALADRTRPYMESRSAALLGWNPTDKSMLIATRFANTAQVHRVAMPGGARTQLSFEADRVSTASWARRRGDVLLLQKDVGGSEFFQLYTLAGGRLTLLTDGKSRNEFNAWSRDGRWVAYTSTRRTGADSDIYVIDPRDPKSDRLVAEVKGGGWSVADFSPDGSKAVVFNYISVSNVDPYELDIASGKLTPIGDPSKDVAYGGAAYAPDGTLWATSDEGSDFQRLGVLDPKTGAFRAVAPEPKWDVEYFDIADDGSFIAYVVNEAGASKLKLLDPKTGAVRTAKLPYGVVTGLDIAPWGTVGFGLSAARTPSDTFSLDPATMAVTQWTFSETGGLEPARNVEPEFVEVKSFDGEPVSGFLYRPDPARFTGKRPLIVDIHGGPEGQERPYFSGRDNYLINELGVAVFFPNVRGSTGYGKRFVGLDNGPFKREDSVKDIGAFLDRFDKDAALDPARFAVTGGSYGGYMCYAVAIRYGARLRGANCIVAISNFVTFLENTQSYRRDLRRVEYGDERDPKQRAKLLEISPLTSVGKLTIPLMVTAGANDPRVPQSEAEQIVKSVRGKGGTAWYLLAKDEGHGFAKKENADYYFWASLLFWQQNLLGGASQ